MDAATHLLKSLLKKGILFYTVEPFELLKYGYTFLENENQIVQQPSPTDLITSRANVKQ